MTAFHPCIIAPTYHNLGTLPSVMERVAALGLSIFVVDDGCTDATPIWLREWSARRPSQGVVLTHAQNQGKAAALQTGFAAARAAGFTHAATIDTDGQLDPEQIPDLLKIAEAQPRALVVGARDDRKADYPARSRIGRRLSNLMIWLESGARIDDSQCGLRVYPLAIFDVIRSRTGRFAFEAEVIPRAAWAGCSIVSVAVNCRYFEGEKRISHFRPWRDSLQGIRLHARLLGRALLPWPHAQCWPDCAPERRPWKRACWRNLRAWASPREMWRQIKRDRIGRLSLATGLGVGVFIANLPVYPFQTLVSLYVARRLHMHPLAVVLGSAVTTPPLGIAFIFAGLQIGHLLLHGSWLALDDFRAAADEGFAELLQMAGGLLVEWLVGGVVLGVLLGMATFALSYAAFNGLRGSKESTEPTLK